MAPEPRPVRVPKPSQKVRAAAAVTKPATKKAKKCTAKEAVDLADDEATQAEATQAPCTDDDFLHSEHEDEEPVLPQVFGYTALWGIEEKEKKEHLEETMRDYSSSLLATPLSEFKAWYEGLLLIDLSDHCREKAVLATSHEQRVEGRWYTDGGTESDFSRLVRRLKDWHDRGQGALQMSFTGKVEKTPTAVTVAAAAAAVSQPVRGRRPHRSTTQRMLAWLLDVCSELESEGNIASQITERWICKQKDCKQYGHVC
jgi:hypothetical protein